MSVARLPALAWVLALLCGCATPPGPGPATASAVRAQPEGSSGYTPKPGWATRRFAVAAANPLAAQAGYQVLKDGGSAVDAAVAVQMVLALVEPQSNGIGGGAFLVHFDGKEVRAFDGRETAPAAAGEQLFLDARGKPMPFADAAVGGRAVGVPGAVRMLELAHRRYGRLPWARLAQPAIALAEQGFPVSPRMRALLVREEHLQKDPVARAYFYDSAGQPWPVGHLLKNPELASMLRLIGAGGSRALLEGEVAQAIVDKVRGHPTNPGVLALPDLARYEARERPALCHDYAAARKELRLCGMPPPSSGAITIGQILGQLANTNAARLPVPQGQPGAQWLHLYAESARLAQADRAQYVADPDFVAPPAGSWMSLLDPAYLAARARLIGERAMETAPAGTPASARASHAPMDEQPEYGTSHISIIDAAGNALAMTTTIEDAWGSRVMVNRGRGLAGGFLLNNELTDFSFAPADDAGTPVANRVQPGKRPRSSMAPTLVFDKADGRLLMTTGSSGGAAIIHYTAKTLYATLNWGMDVQQAIALPNFGVLGNTLVVEEKRFPSATLRALEALGHRVREEPMTSGSQAVQTTPQGLYGGADPRREGIVAGD
ncbi:MAG: gamma-glutamyltransferase family protein [Burkholderiales bacterium]|nr:gamma-glutamyltransferase family protein [Burkholderiales bacterium]